MSKHSQREQTKRWLIEVVEPKIRENREKRREEAKRRLDRGSSKQKVADGDCKIVVAGSEGPIRVRCFRPGNYQTTMKAGGGEVRAFSTGECLGCIATSDGDDRDIIARLMLRNVNNGSMGWQGVYGVTTEQVVPCRAMTPVVLSRARRR